MRALLEEFEPSRERSIVEIKIDEAELWLARCTRSAAAIQRNGWQS